MIGGLIFLLSFLTLLQFFVFYSRALIAESRAWELSEQAREICGLTANAVESGQFRRLLELIAMCPAPSGEGGKVMTVAAYFRLLGVARRVGEWAIPGAASWIDAERVGCAHLAAVVLDRRIAYNRTMMAQQSSH